MSLSMPSATAFVSDFKTAHIGNSAQRAAQFGDNFRQAVGSTLLRLLLVTPDSMAPPATLS
jgi:hypothetical protein